MVYQDSPATAARMQARIATAARARRVAMNVTQQELSDRTGVAIATLRRFEAGEPAGLVTVLAIAVGLDALDGFGGLFPLPDAEPQGATGRRVRAGRR